MKTCLSFVHRICLACLVAHSALAQTGPLQARIVAVDVNPGQVFELHLRPGYVSSVRVLEDVNSVVLGDPGTFRAEHSDAEPRLVFFKTTSMKAAQTNALITTVSGREIALSLVSSGKLDHSEPVDYVLSCERPRSFVIRQTLSTFEISETKYPELNDAASDRVAENSFEQPLPSEPRVEESHWQGKWLQVAVGQPSQTAQGMTLPFAVLNASRASIELLPPGIELAGAFSDKHRKSVKAEPVVIKSYRITARRLPPGGRADGVVVFDRPPFKESQEKLLLTLAQSDKVDRPVLVSVPFVAPVTRGAR